MVCTISAFLLLMEKTVLTPKRAPRGQGSLLHPPVDKTDGRAVRPVCIWCTEKIPKTDGRTGIAFSDMLNGGSSPSGALILAARDVHECTNRSKLCVREPFMGSD